MKKFLFYTLIATLLWYCQKNDSPDKQNKKNFALWQKTEIIKDTLSVDIPIEGKLLAWRKMDLIAPLTARVVSLLVETRDRVQKEDLLLHLWPLSRYQGYTPVEIFSPMNGIVADLYVGLNDTIKQGEILLSLENRDNLTMRAKINKWQAPFIKRNANVTLFHENLKIKGAVLDVDNKDYWVTVIVPNQQLKLEEDVFVNGYIHLQNIRGNFLPADYFGQNDSILVELDEETSLNLFKVGLAGDSLILFTPSLPDINEIQIKKNLDFNK